MFNCKLTQKPLIIGICLAYVSAKFINMAILLFVLRNATQTKNLVFKFDIKSLKIIL